MLGGASGYDATKTADESSAWVAWIVQLTGLTYAACSTQKIPAGTK